MSRYKHTDDRQMELGFNARLIPTENSSPNQTNVVNLNAFARSCELLSEPNPVLERLLQEAQKLKW